MLSAESVIDQVVSRYPEEFRERLRSEIMELLKRDRSYVAGQIQMAAAQYCNTCPTLGSLRAEIDQILFAPSS